jgi:hypothetical protein
MCHVETTITDHPEVLRAGIRFDAVVIDVTDVVTDDVARHGHHWTVRPAIRISIGGVIDSVVEVLHTVVFDDVT